MESDAAEYGVTVEVATAAAGAKWRWVATRVHHLTAGENNGNHNLYVTLLDENLARARTRTAWIAWPTETTYEYTIETILQDKPENEAGGNAPLWKHQVVSCGVNVNSDEVSDVVRGIHTEHPDEPPATPGGNLGNTLYHHSFLVEFTRTAVGDPEPTPDPGPGDEDDEASGDEDMPALGDVPERYWGWIETASHALSLAMYRLNVVVAAGPAVGDRAARAAAGVDEVRKALTG